MTVKQLRDWLIKQDETAKVYVETGNEGAVYVSFAVRVLSQVHTNLFDAQEPGL